MFLRMRSFAVNAKKVSWSDRAIFVWSSLLWFTSFHKPGSTMLSNMRNMVLESVAMLFLAIRSDVSQPRRLTSEACEHTFGSVRQLQREFNVEQFNNLVERMQLRVKSIFGSSLIPSRSSMGKGYQATFADFINSLQNASAEPSQSGIIDVVLTDKAVTQLWPTVKAIFDKVNPMMTQFLKLFGVDELNGLSPFAAANINSPQDLLSLIKAFYCAPKKDTRDCGGVVGDEEEVVDGNEDEDEDVDEANDGVGDIIPVLANELLLAFQDTEGDGAVAEVEDNEDSMEENPSNDDDDVVLGSQFDEGAAGDARLKLNVLMSSTTTSTVPIQVKQLMELMVIGKIEQGSVLPDGKYTSLQARWFHGKKKSMDNSTVSEDATTFIERNSVVSLKCKRGKIVTVEKYRVLCIFSKSYNKWYVEWDNEQVPFQSSSKKYKILARLLKQVNNSQYQEVELKEGGNWGPQSVFCVKYMCDIERIDDCRLESMMD